MTNPRWCRPGWLRSAAAVGAIAGMLGAASPASAQPAAGTPPGWPQLQGGASHTGDEPGENSITAANVRQLRLAWSHTFPGWWPGTQPVVSGGVVYAASGDDVTAFDATSGAQLWQTTLPGYLTGTPAVQDGMALVAIGADATSGGWPKLLFPAAGWQDFTASIKAGRDDRA